MRQAFTNESASSSMPPTNRARLFTSQSSILLLKPHAHTVPHPPSLIANLVRTQPAFSCIQEKRYAEPSRTSNSLSLSCFVSLSPDSTPVHDDATHTHTAGPATFADDDHHHHEGIAATNATEAGRHTRAHTLHRIYTSPHGVVSKYLPTLTTL